VLSVGKVRTSITLDEDVLEEVKRLADEDSRKTSQMINKILRDLLLEHRKSGEVTQR